MDRSPRFIHSKLNLLHSLTSKRASQVCFSCRPSQESSTKLMLQAIVSLIIDWQAIELWSKASQIANLKSQHLHSPGLKKYIFFEKNLNFKKILINFCFLSQILGVSSVSSFQTKYDLKSDLNIIDTLTSTEVHSLRVNLRSQVGASVISRQYLRLKGKPFSNRIFSNKSNWFFFLCSGDSKSSKIVTGSSLAETINSIKLNNNVKLVEDDLQIMEVPNSCTASSCSGVS